MESDAQPIPVAVARPRRRWLQFSTRALLVVVTALCVTLGVVGWQAERQRRTVVLIEAMGGKILYESDRAMLRDFARFVVKGEDFTGDRPSKWLPRDWVESVVVVNLDNCAVNDADLIHLQSFPSLESVYLNDTKIGDAGVAHLHDHSELDHFAAANTRITDAGLKCLQRHKKLTWIVLVGTQATDNGIAELQSNLPNCRIFD